MPDGLVPAVVGQVEWCGPHVCARCRKAGQPAVWQHVRVVGRACTMERIADCLDHRMEDMGLRPARQEKAA